MENNHETDDDHFDKFLSAYPDYVKKDYPLLVPPGMMERVNAALPSKEEWAKEFEKLREANPRARCSSSR